MRSFLTVIIFLFALVCHSQTQVRVSDPRLEMNGNTLLIKYDILSGDADDKYIISVVINDEDGYKIIAGALEGDIGKEVAGGYNKQIRWDLEADNIFLDAYVYVQVNAILIPPAVPVIVEIEKDPIQEEDIVQEEMTPTKAGSQEEIEPDKVIQVEDQNRDLPETKEYKRAALVMQSLAFPGLGLSRYTGKPHWLRGVLGYGCIAGSVILNQQAIKNYNDLDNKVFFNEFDAAYDKSVQQDNISEILAYTAIGIWVTDFIWTLVGTSDLKDNNLYSQFKGFSIGSKLDPVSSVPLVSLSYRF